MARTKQNARKPTGKTVPKSKKEPIMAITSTVHRATASELALFRQCFNQGISKKKKHVVVDGDMVITTWK